MSSESVSSESVSSAATPQKSITTLGSIFLFVNNAVGPGLVLIPALYQESGWLPNVISILILCALTYIVGRMLTYSIRSIPHNTNDDLRIEYLDLIQYYISNPLIQMASQIVYISFMLCILMGGLIQTCQTFDLLIAKILGQSYGIAYYPTIDIVSGNSLNDISPFGRDSINSLTNDDASFDSEAYVASIGTMIIYLVLLPFCFSDLEEAIWIQYIATIGTMFVMAMWCVLLSFSSEFDTANVPVITTEVKSVFAQVFAVGFYNVAFICTYPSWLNEKKSNVSHKFVLKCVCGITLFFFVLIGLFGGMAFKPYYKTTNDMLSKLNNFKPTNDIAYFGAFFKNFGPYSAYCYPILQCATGIPVYCAVIRYNLLSIQMTHYKWFGNVIAICVPFIVSILLYHGSGVQYLLNWSGVLLSSAINFIFPIYFYYKTCVRPSHVWKQIAMSEYHLETLSKSNYNLLSLQDTATNQIGDPCNTIAIANNEIEIETENNKKLETKTVEIDESNMIGRNHSCSDVEMNLKCDLIDHKNRKKQRKRTKSESDILVKDRKNAYKSFENLSDIDPFGNDNDSNDNDITVVNAKKAKKVLALLIFTISLAVFAFVMDVVHSYS